ncbi:MAG: penicillin-binding protein activator LpoB [bacterium]|nr:penicillin-binding protein activator LpoB [bacterium]
MTPNIRPVLVLLAIGLLVLAGCAGKQVTRVDVEEQIDLSGKWNDTDSQMVAEELVMQIIRSPWVEDFMAEKGKKPYVIIGTVRNKTPEHIPVYTFIRDLEKEFINGGRVRVVASADEREQVRMERADQQEFSSEATMKQWGREKGADYMLIGQMNFIRDAEDGTEVKYYQVDCDLVDLEDNVKVWAGDHRIKKVVGKGKYKP